MPDLRLVQRQRQDGLEHEPDPDVPELRRKVRGSLGKGMSDTVGQTTLESLTEDIHPPIKCNWRSRPACGKCGVWLSKGWFDDKGNFQRLNEDTCAHCGAVNRLD